MKNKILYFECFSGISGDMTVAALLDLGASQKKMENALMKLKLDGFSTVVNRLTSYGIDACNFEVLLHENYPHHHHENYPHHHHEHNHNEHEHEHEHKHEHVHEHNHHEHRTLPIITEIIKSAELGEHVECLALKMFQIVAEAEAKAHGIDILEVHFHEVGAVDSIVDIVAVAVCLDDLGINKVIVPSICEGHGSVKCQHGILPIPVPAVLNIVTKFKLPLKITETKGEMVTPTGAAIIAAIKTTDILPSNYRILKAGIGAGKRDFGHANILRVMILEEFIVDNSESNIWVIETNLDDSTGEELGLAMEKVFLAGAIDVSFTPIFMKKNRPGYLLRALAKSKDLSLVESAIFQNTPSIGLRKYLTSRTILERQTELVDLPMGKVEVKKCKFGTQTFIKPEYESVKKLAEISGIDFKTIFEEAKKL